MLAAGVRQVAGAVPSAAGQEAAQMQALQASGNMPWRLQKRWPLLRCQLVWLCRQPGRQWLPCHCFMLRAMQRCLKLRLTGVLCSFWNVVRASSMWFLLFSHEAVPMQIKTALLSLSQKLLTILRTRLVQMCCTHSPNQSECVSAALESCGMQECEWCMCNATSLNRGAVWRLCIQ